MDLGLVEDFDFSPRPPSELLFSQIEFTLLFPYFSELYLSHLERLASSSHSSGFVIEYLNRKNSLKTESLNLLTFDIN